MEAPADESGSAPCLSHDDLLALVAGRLDADRLARAETHLDLCEECNGIVAGLARDTRPIDRPGGPWPRSTFVPGERLAGRYELGRLLGAGGMGEVYEAQDGVLGETIALKTIALDVPLDDPASARLMAEVQLARRVTHPNVCRVFDVGFHEAPDPRGREPGMTVPFLTMELLRGETLRARLRRRRRLGCAEAVTILEGMAAGLDAAHAAGVVHADLKCENVMLVPQGEQTRVVLMDFGLARPFREASRSHPSGTFLGGTLGYMAPEQLQGRAASPASDIHALGVVLFEMLAGRLPFAGGGPDGTSARRSSLDSFGVKAPAAFDAAIDRCLAVDPRRRFATAAELVAALRGGSPVRRLARRLGGHRRFALVLGAVGAIAASGTIVWQQGRRSSGPAAPALEARMAASAPASIGEAPARVDELAAAPVAGDRPARRTRGARRTAARPAPPATAPARAPRITPVKF